MWLDTCKRSSKEWRTEKPKLVFWHKTELVNHNPLTWNLFTHHGTFYHTSTSARLNGRSSNSAHPSPTMTAVSLRFIVRLELREQKVRLDKEFGEMLGKIADRKDRLLHMEKKLATLDRTRLGKEVHYIQQFHFFLAVEKSHVRGRVSRIAHDLGTCGQKTSQLTCGKTCMHVVVAPIHSFFRWVRSIQTDVEPHLRFAQISSVGVVIPDNIMLIYADHARTGGTPNTGAQAGSAS